MSTSKTSSSVSATGRWLLACGFCLLAALAWWLESTLGAVLLLIAATVQGVDAILTPPAPQTADPPPTEIPPTYCRDCVSFDTKAGQAQLRKFPAFAKVASILTPDQLVHAGLPHDEARKHDDGSGWPDASPSSETAVRLGGRPHTWDQYGLCGRHGEIVNCFYTCPLYKKQNNT